jgi:hypothetical protein
MERERGREKEGEGKRESVRGKERNRRTHIFLTERHTSCREDRKK